MIWQDYVIAAVGWAFALALIPTLLPSASKPHVATAFLNTLLLLLLGVTMSTLGLYGGAASMILTSVLWSVIGLQGMGRQYR